MKEKKASKTVSVKLPMSLYDAITEEIPLVEKGKRAGKPLVSHGQFIKELVVKRKVVMVDRKVEEYKVASAARIGNNLNQIAYRLNSDHLADKINYVTYNEICEDLKVIRAEMNRILAPIS